MTLGMVIEIPDLNIDDWWQKTQDEYTKYWKKDIRPYWKKEEDPHGDPWPKRKKDYDWKMLRRTGLMQDTAELVRVKKDLFGVKIKKYGIYAQTGTKNMDQRKWLGIPEKGTRRLAKLSSKHILNNGRTRTVRI